MSKNNNTETNKQMHGWYSEKQKDNAKRMIKNNRHNKRYTKLTTSCIYLNAKGQEVEVTEVTSTKNNDSNFDDKEYLGILTKFVRGIYYE